MDFTTTSLLKTTQHFGRLKKNITSCTFSCKFCKAVYSNKSFFSLILVRAMKRTRQASLSIKNVGHFKPKSNLIPSERCLSYTNYCIFKYNNYGTLSYFTTSDTVLPNVLYFENIIAK